MMTNRQIANASAWSTDHASQEAVRKEYRACVDRARQVLAEMDEAIASAMAVLDRGSI